MDLRTNLSRYLDDETISKLLFSLDNEDSFHAVLVNTNKIDDSFLLDRFKSLTKFDLVEHVYYYSKEIDQLGKSIYFDQGLYYLYEPCSSLVTKYLDPQEDDIILDLCSAPGGKGIHTAITKKNKGLVIANEINRPRALILSSNVERMGLRNVIVTNNSVDDFISNNYKFDKIILDAPCSGSGMFRKETKMKDDWSINKVLSLSVLQKELIIKAFNLLKEGGTMVYSTCSYSLEEDDEIIDYLLNNNLDAEEVIINDDPRFFKYKHGIHLFPHLFNGEGHYIAAIKKKGLLDPNNKKEIKLDKKILEINKQFNLDGYTYNFENIYYNIPQYFDFKRLRVLRGGLKIGTLEKYGFDIDHAYSRYLDNYQNEVELNDEELNRYLKGEQLTKACKDGYVLIKYEGHSIGLGKAKDNRINNKYPKGLRK